MFKIFRRSKLLDFARFASGMSVENRQNNMIASAEQFRLLSEIPPRQSAAVDQYDDFAVFLPKFYGIHIRSPAKIQNIAEKVRRFLI